MKQSDHLGVNSVSALSPNEAWSQHVIDVMQTPALSHCILLQAPLQLPLHSASENNSRTKSQCRTVKHEMLQTLPSV